MKEQFKVYLKSIGITDTLIKRVEMINDFYQDICSEEITDIFMNDFIRDDGTREYDSLWLFSKTYIMEAKSFISKDDFDVTPLHKKVTYIMLEKQDYDFVKATEKSRASLKLTFNNNLSGKLKSSKENCDFLRDVLRKHIMPNLS
jgi:hypothetical protein